MVCSRRASPTPHAGDKRSRADLRGAGLRRIASGECPCLPLRLIFGVHEGSVGLFIAAPNILQSLVETQFYANYPDCTLDRLPAGAFDATSGEEILHMDLLLVPDLFPFRRYAQFEDSLNRVTADPLMVTVVESASLPGVVA